jgi:penicillin-binding protein 1C
MKLFLKIIIVIFVLSNICFLTLFFYPVPKALEALKPNDTIKIYDRNDELLYEVLNEDTGRQSFISLAEIPQTIKDAFLSIEDKNFYEHSGVDFSAILRAVWQNVSSGEIVSGGSTITQQVVRNVIGAGKKRTLLQKINESILALKISKFLDKDQVFEVYLNSIYFGGLAYGVESASWQYFDKSAANLDLAESAFLAGLPQAPNSYYPFKYFDAAKKRQEEVLSVMLDNKKISETDFKQAKDEELHLKQDQFAKKAPHFVDYVLQSLRENGSEPDKKIVTTLDLGMQNRAENILQSDLTFLTKYNIENAALVILDAKNGDILTMIGSADYDNTSIQGAVNVATSLRQPGSSIKPLIYAEAIEKGWKPDTIITDEPIQFSTPEGLPYSPKNYDMTYHGDVTLGEALAQSINIPAVKTLDFVGIASFLNKAPSFGITTLNLDPDHYGLSLALGSGEVELLELTNAYSTFANGGKRVSTRFIKSDETPSSVTVINPTTAQDISAILSSNDLRMPAFGEENSLKFSFPVAAKTGTTRSFHDNWTIGYTDDYVVGVWVGNSRGELMQGVSGISGAAPIFNKIMNMLHETTGTVLTVKSDIRIGEQQNPENPEGGQSIARLQDLSDDKFHIITPFANDLYLFDPTKPTGFQKIKLQASESAEWFVDDMSIGEGEFVLWELKRGAHQIKAVSGDNEERVVGINVR